MKQAATDLIERLLDQSGLTLESLLWLLLAVSLLFAAGHLVTMLATRWGDRRAMGKSLLFSLVVHCSCALGLMGMHLQAGLDQEARQPDEDRPVPLRRVIVENDEAARPQEGGDVPVWDRLPDPQQTPVARAERTSPDLTPLEVPERHSEPVAQGETVLPDLPSLPDDRPVAAPRPESADDPGLRHEAATPLPVDAPEAEARPEVGPQTAPPVRRRIAGSDLPEAEVAREPARGAVERFQPEFDFSRELASVDLPSDPAGIMRRGAEDDTLRRRTGPAPSSLPVEEPGAESDGDETGSPAPQALARQRTWTPGSRPSTPVERSRTQRAPRTLDSEPSTELAVRERIVSDVPRSEPVPGIVRPDFEPLRSRQDGQVPSTYRLRNVDRRREIARQHGGTDASEKAVELSLQWLARQQTADGYWEAARHGAGRVKVDEQGVDRQNAGRQAETGLTALTVLAFLGAGYTHEEGRYAPQVDRALRWLIRNQTADGSLAGRATHYERMYCHAMATYALAEAYGMQSDPTADTGLRGPLTRAVGYIIDNQNPDGGWRYVKGQKSDMSMFGWQLMALKSAEIAGLPLPEASRRKMIQFLQDRSVGPRSGLAAYREELPPTPSMTAEALFSKQMLGISRTNPASIEATDYLLRHPPKRSEWNLYYWYYGTLAMYQYGGKSWQTWNESLRDLLVAEQVTTGPNAGSWEPRGPWGPYGGRIYSTTLGTLCLEVYYRFLPLYQMGGRYEEPAP